MTSRSKLALALTVLQCAGFAHAQPLGASHPDAGIDAQHATDASLAAEVFDATDADAAPTDLAADVIPTADVVPTADVATEDVTPAMPAVAPTPVAAPVAAALDDGGPPRDAPTRYVLRASLDAAHHQVNASGTLAWRNTSTVAVRDLWMHLYLNGFSNERTLFMRTTGGEHRGNGRGQFGHIEVQRIDLQTPSGAVALAHAPDEPTLDPSELHLLLPREVRPGEAITLEMQWTSVLPEVFARTGYRDRFHMVAQWFPKIAVLAADGTWGHFPFHGNTEFYADFGTYDVTLDVPRGWTVGACGERQGSVEHTPSGDRMRFLTRTVHDFAFTAWDAFRELRGIAGDVEVTLLFPPGEEGQAQRALANLRQTIPFFADRFGPYPYPNLTVVFPPEGAEGAGGMEYPTLITTEGAWWMPERLRFVEYVTAHEFGHQYFYGLFASNENAFPMLDEGLTEWATCLAMEHAAPPDGAIAAFDAARFACIAQEGSTSASILFPQAVISNAADFSSFGTYAEHVYARTASTLRTAENLYGADRVANAFRRYAARARFRHPTPEDLFAAFDEELGEVPVAQLLRPGLTLPSSVDYAVTCVEDIPLGGGRRQGRVVVNRRGTLSLPVTVTLELNDGNRTRVRWDGHGTVFETFSRPGVGVHAAWVDPEARIALDEDRLNNARLVESQEGPVFPLFSRVAYWVGLALQAVGP